MSKSFRVATSVRVARIIAVCLALTFATACGDLLSNDTQDRPTSTPSQSESVFYAPGSADDESPVVDISMDAALSADQSRIASEQLAGPEVVTSRFFLLDTETLRNDEDSYLRLQLPDDRRLVFKTTGVLTRENGFTWYGRIVAGGKGLAYLSVVDGDAAGQIFGARGRFVVRPLGGGAHAIYQVDQGAYAACGMPPGEDLPAHTDGMVEPTDFGADIAADDGSVIDVLVAYTPGAASQTGNIAADIQAAIDDANNAYRLSAISTRLNLVHTVQVDYEDSLDQCADRDALQDPDDGEMDDVHTLRDTYGADLVALLTKSGLYCGCAYVPDALDVANEDIGFSATAINCAIGNHSFAHEIGHNFGARHDRDADPIENKPTAYNHGSSLEKNSSGWFRTIMSYDRAGKCGDSPSKPDCERLPLFSSPNIFYGSRPRLGRVEYYSTGTYDYEDNARMHNEAASYVANYRAGSDARPPLEDETNSDARRRSGGHLSHAGKYRRHIHPQSAVRRRSGVVGCQQSFRRLSGHKRTAPGLFSLLHGFRQQYIPRLYATLDDDHGSQHDAGSQSSLGGHRQKHGRAKHQNRCVVFAERDHRATQHHLHDQHGRRAVFCATVHHQQQLQMVRRRDTRTFAESVGDLARLFRLIHRGCPELFLRSLRQFQGRNSLDVFVDLHPADNDKCLCRLGNAGAPRQLRILLRHDDKHPDDNHDNGSTRGGRYLRGE
ncbi:MAG: hypothetical protein H6685_07460 [Deltaproteobacteria bacterium]|nr:hypothetical protein [Deltaproteobacteria bacterium]